VYQSSFLPGTERGAERKLRILLLLDTYFFQNCLRQPQQDMKDQVKVDGLEGTKNNMIAVSQN